MRPMKRQDVDLDTVRLFTPEQLAMYMSLGVNSAREFGKQAGAVIKFGKRCVYDRKIIDEAIDKLNKES